MVKIINSKVLKDIRKLRTTQAESGGVCLGSLPLSKYPFSTIQFYSILVSKLKLTYITDRHIYKIVNNLPRKPLLLVRYFFEVIYVISIIVFFISYLLFIPKFRGYFSLFVMFAITLYIVTSSRVYDYDKKINRCLSKLEREIKKSSRN